jgi:hypothetical protein
MQLIYKYLILSKIDAMEVYFVVLQLPGSCGLKFIEGHSPEHFWKTVSGAVKRREAKVVSIRPDTGVSEELRDHVADKEFSSYFIFYMMMAKQDVKNNDLILQKAADIIKIGNHEALIDSDDNFQLVTLDYSDMSNLSPTFGSGSPQVSA